MSKHPNKALRAALRQDWLLYLIAEVEKAVERDGPEWNAPTAKAAQERLDKIAARAREIASGLKAS